MLGIDTNVLVRYIMQDDPTQSRLATHFIEKESAEDNPIFITALILCELVWVLESAYEYSKKDIIKVIESILKTRQFHIHESDILWQTLRSYQKDGADFADNYIGILNLHNKCVFTATFDKKASRLSHFKLLGASV